jgi:tryptophan 7-halogenase
MFGMTGSIHRVAIVGGGTAGWLAAAVLAARLPSLSVTLVEAPDIPTIGVGEGTWPTMRETLATIGIAEADFLAECDASFKQGSRFDGWVTGSADDSYLHPFTLPPAGDMRAILGVWQAARPATPFATAMTAQAAACAANLAPRQRAMPDYAGALNYGYHLDAGKFAALLMRHATRRLGVAHVSGAVSTVLPGPGGDIAALALRDGRTVEADLFIDCTGQASLLLGGHAGVEWIDRSDVSFNDRALALQLPVAPDSPIASQTIGTAHAAGWIWDIGLPTRRGIGCVYSSRFLSDDQAETTLRAYVSRQAPGHDPLPEPRRLAFRPGHRARFWQGNCIGVGQAAGFIEPLEASAIVMAELSIRALCDAFPADRADMDLLASRFNTLFRYRWERIIEFLKLHYVLSRREEPYWQAQRDPATIPQRLAENLLIWQHRPPGPRDFPEFDEMFPAASQQYILYGMGFAGSGLGHQPTAEAASLMAASLMADVQQRARVLLATLPENRACLAACAATGADRARRTA